MQHKRYPSKWHLSYNGKVFSSVYGKKKAYELYISLSDCLLGLKVEPAAKKKRRTAKEIAEYSQRWREKNRDKVRAYNRKSYLKRKNQEKEGRTRMIEETELKDAKIYELFARWEQADIPSWMRREMKHMSESAKRECFGSSLRFGTGGLRAEIGAGTNRINLFTIRKATKGLADDLLAQGSHMAERGVAIAYDSRRFSREFAEEAGLVLAANGIEAYVFGNLRPTPMLSFAVRHLHAAAGIVITASHNPPEYSGYKVYNEEGSQIPPQAGDRLTDAIERVGDELAIETLSMREATRRGLFTEIGNEVDRAYYKQMMESLRDTELNTAACENVKIVYTPLHGTGSIPVQVVLDEAGFNQVFVVGEQEMPDANFPTVDSPNPEERDALRLGINLAYNVKADIVIGTDPDADRVGVAVRSADGEYVCMNGNQIGALMVDYLLKQKRSKGTLPNNGVILRTIVTSNLGRVIAADYGVETVDTLTGFKYIGEKIGEYERTREKQFLFGYEESCGYLAGDYVRDKDAVQACLLICRLAAWHRERGITLDRVLNKLYEKYGYYREGLHSYTLKGMEGVQRINAMMDHLRYRELKEIGAWRVHWIRDYKHCVELHLDSQTRSCIGLPSSDVMHYTLDDGSWFAVRPSGTEPKLKAYFSVVGKAERIADAKLANLKRHLLDLLQDIQTHLDQRA